MLNNHTNNEQVHPQNGSPPFGFHDPFLLEKRSDDQCDYRHQLEQNV